MTDFNNLAEEYCSQMLRDMWKKDLYNNQDIQEFVSEPKTYGDNLPEMFLFQTIQSLDKKMTTTTFKKKQTPINE